VNVDTLGQGGIGVMMTGEEVSVGRDPMLQLTEFWHDIPSGNRSLWLTTFFGFTLQQRSQGLHLYIDVNVWRRVFEYAHSFKLVLDKIQKETTSDTSSREEPMRKLSKVELFASSTGLHMLKIPVSIDRDISGLVSENVTRAAQIVTSLVIEEIESGLPARELKVERLDDYDSGEWSELLFVLGVNLPTEEANRAWDHLLGKLSQQAEELAKHDQAVAEALTNKLGLIFEWL
jgi:hypothetical protein